MFADKQGKLLVSFDIKSLKNKRVVKKNNKIQTLEKINLTLIKRNEDQRFTYYEKLLILTKQIK